MKYALSLYFIFSCLFAFTQEHHEPIHSEQSLEVAVFLGLECPISQKYISRLNDIYKKFEAEKILKWSFIIPAKVEDEDIKRFTGEYNAAFPIVSDDQKLSRTKYFGATVTPQAIVKQNGKTLYIGAIDNWFYELGRYRSQTTEHYLIDVLEAVTNNKQPRLKETQAFGCFIEMNSTMNTHHKHD